MTLDLGCGVFGCVDSVLKDRLQSFAVFGVTDSQTMSAISHRIRASHTIPESHTLGNETSLSEFDLAVSIRKSLV